MLSPPELIFATRDYVNKRYGFKLRCPATLSVGPERTDGSGQEFHTANGEFKVYAFAMAATMNPEEKLDCLFAQEQGLFGAAATYQVKNQKWFVLSGVGSSSTEFYSKVYARGSTVTFLRMTCPHGRHRRYDKIVTAIEKRFVPAQN